MRAWDDKRFRAAWLKAGKGPRLPSRAFGRDVGSEDGRQLRTHRSRSRSRSDSGWKWKGVDENKTPKNKRFNENANTDRTRRKQKNGPMGAMKQNEAMDVHGSGTTKDW